MNESTRLISFDINGICNFCRQDSRVQSTYRSKYNDFGDFVDFVKSNKNGRSEYHCVIGVSGGIDSSYVALKAYEAGLNALLVHVDNGWNTSKANKNIERLVNFTGYPLHTYVIDWEEFKSVQRALIDSDVIDVELVTDHAFKAYLYRFCLKSGIKFILSGENSNTESIMPGDWNWSKTDARNIVALAKAKGISRIKSIPLLGAIPRQLLERLGFVSSVPVLELFNYKKQDAKEVLINSIGWTEPGRKHDESLFTKFYQNTILPQKFGVDKRRAHLSNLILNGELSRDEALKVLDSHPGQGLEYSLEESYCLLKLGYDDVSFKAYLGREPVEHSFYPNEMKYVRRLQVFFNVVKNTIGYVRRLGFREG